MLSRFKLVGAMLTIGLLLSLNATAASFNSDSTLSGVIDEVNFRTNTLVIVNDETGRKEAYLFDQSTKVIVKGRVMRSREILKPGLVVRLKMPATKTGLAQSAL